MCANASTFIRWGLVISLWPWSTSSAGASDKIVAGRTMVLPAPSAGKRLVGVWNAGSYLSVEDSHSAAPRLKVFDGNGNEISQLTFSFPGARQINIYNGGFSRALDGTLALCGSAYTDDGRAGTFIARVSPNGEQLVTRVTPYVPYAIVLAADGAIWAAGMVLIDGRAGPPDHPIIRRFDKNGTLTKALLPRSDVATRIHPVADSYLVTSGDRVGWYSQSAGLYVEFSTDGRELNRLPGPLFSAGSRVNGAALSDTGDVYVSAADAAKITAWEIFKLHRDSGTWRRVEMDKPHKSGILFGAEGRHLIMSTGLPTLTWFTVD